MWYPVIQPAFEFKRNTANRLWAFSNGRNLSFVIAQVQTCFPEQLLGSFVACQSQMHGNACECKEHELLVEVKTRSSYAPPPWLRLRGQVVQTNNLHPETSKTQLENTSGPWFAKEISKRVSRIVMLNYFQTQQISWLASKLFLIQSTQDIFLLSDSGLER